MSNFHPLEVVVRGRINSSDDKLCSAQKIQMSVDKIACGRCSFIQIIHYDINQKLS